MMMSPEVYCDEIKKYTKEELLSEKNKLESFINRYNNDSLNEEKTYYKPSLKTMVKVYKEYLKKVEQREKMNRGA